MNNDDFLNLIADVNILEAEAVGEVVGRVIAALFKGMVGAGMSEADAHRVIQGAFSEMTKATMGPRSS